MKKVFLILLLLFLIPLLHGCSNDPVIVFSGSPFSKDSKFVQKSVFKKGEKIYFLAYNPKGFKTRLVKVQVFARNDADKTEFWGYNYLYNRTVELKDKKIYTDFFVINKSGQYIFQIFEFTNMQKPVALGIIKVQD